MPTLVIVELKFFPELSLIRLQKDLQMNKIHTNNQTEHVILLQVSLGTCISDRKITNVSTEPFSITRNDMVYQKKWQDGYNSQ